MSDLQIEEMKRVLFESVTELLMNGHPVELDGLGVFSVEHREAQLEDPGEETASGAETAQPTRIYPPMDLVRFQEIPFSPT